MRVAEREHDRRVGVKKPRAMPMKSIRVVGLVAAGVGEFNVDPEAGEIMVPANLAREDHLGWTIDGDSMMPALEPGDIAVFKESRQPRSNLAFLIKTNDGLRCKRLRWSVPDSDWKMESINPRYSPEPLGTSEVLGVLIGYYRVQGLHEKFEANPEGLRLD